MLPTFPLKGIFPVILKSAASLGSRGEGRVHEMHDWSVHVYLHRCVYIHVESIGWCWMSSLVTLHLTFEAGFLAEVSVLTALDSQALLSWPAFFLHGFWSEHRSLVGLATNTLVTEPSPHCYFVGYPMFPIGYIEDRYSVLVQKPSNHRQLIWTETPDMELDTRIG